jgi:hypothetical protein
MGRGLSLRVCLFVTLAASALGNSSAACTPFHDDPAGGSSPGVADGGDGASRSGLQRRQGFDLTAGGNVSKSPSYKLVGAVGESPGGNGMNKSKSYTLKGGVVSDTQ